MSDCIMKFKLKQETPMIHFQYDEPGATLRASDVKPRLDKFLYDVYGNKELAPFVKDKDHSALDYKMSFIAPYENKNGEQVHETPEKKEPKASFFGNMGKHEGDEDFRLSIKYTEPIDGKIICFHTKLFDYIKESIASFFFFENFGTREDKGYGCYRVESIDGRKENTSVSRLVNFYNIHKEVEVFSLNDMGCSRHGNNNHLDNIDMFYKMIKSGINFKTRNGKYYIKAFLTEYMLDQKIGGEKRWIKQEDVKVGPAIGKSKKMNADDSDVAGYNYIRALLGIGDKQEWQDDPFEINIKDVRLGEPLTGNTSFASVGLKLIKKIDGKIKAVPLDKDKGKIRFLIKEEKNKNDVYLVTPIYVITFENGLLKRFHSPIRFVQYANKLYVVCFEPESIIYGKEFTIKNEYTGKDTTIPTLPIDKKINIHDFMEKMKSWVDEQKEFYDYSGNSYEFSLEEVR